MCGAVGVWCGVVMCAMQVLESAPFERVESFFYKYSYALMDAQPARTVAAWMSKPGKQAAAHRRRMRDVYLWCG
jgi:hypothetical protein